MCIYFFKIVGLLQFEVVFESRDCVVDILDLFVMGDDLVVEVVGGVIREQVLVDQVVFILGRILGNFIWVNQVVWFGKVSQGNDILYICYFVVVVGDLNFKFFDFEEVVDLWQVLQRVVEVVVVVESQEEVVVFVVFIGVDFKFLYLVIVFNLDIFLLGMLLGDNGCQVQVFEFQFCFQAEEVLFVLNQVVLEWQVYVIGFNFLQDSIFFFFKVIGVVVQFNLVVKVEVGVGVVSGGQVEFFFDFIDYVYVDIYVEVEVGQVLLLFGQVRVFCDIGIDVEGQVDIILWVDVYFCIIEEVFQEVFFYVDFFNGVKGFGSFGGINVCQFIEIILLILFLMEVEVFIKGYKGRWVVEVVVNFFGNDILFGSWVKFYILFNGIGVIEVKWIGIWVCQKVVVVFIDVWDGI